MENNQYENMEIDFSALILKLWKEKFTILKVMGIGFMVGLIISLSLPKTYKVNVIISPETDQNNGTNSLGGMASMLGIGNMGIANQDALNSTMFPDLIKSTPFIIEMYNIQIASKKIPQKTSLSDYIALQKEPWWNYIFKAPSFIKSFFSTNKITEKNDTINPFKLTGEQKRKIELIKASLSAAEEKKTGMTIVSATLQDPEIAAIVADSTVKKLQRYIINYRIRKAQDDCNYLEKLCKDRKNEYLKAQQVYADFMDANRNVILQRTQAEGTRLQNEMSMAFQVYSQVETQLQVARAKVQETKPVFAIVEPASVPLTPSSPNKPLIIIAFMFLSFIGSSFWILFGKDLWNNIRIHKNN